MFPIEMMMLPNHGGREGRKPIVIVNHVTVGGKESVINTFRNTANKVSSTFLNCRDGSIVQFCEITQRPKTNGNIRSPRSSLVKQMGGINPNLYSVTIENEDAFNDDTPGVDGQLTETQFLSLCWLHKFIQTEVKRIYGHTIQLNSHQVLGHRDIDSIGKGFCPGNNFPMDRLLAELAIANNMSLEEYEERIEFLRSPSSERVTAYAFAERVQDLSKKLGDSKWGKAAQRKILLLTPSLEGMGYAGEITPEAIVSRVIILYKQAMSGQYEKESLRKLLIGANCAKEVGLL